MYIPAAIKMQSIIVNNKIQSLNNGIPQQHTKAHV